MYVRIFTYTHVQVIYNTENTHTYNTEIKIFEYI